jgi:pimeloyl-ACP methyl ester carboxylesterase
MNTVNVNGADLEYDVRGSGEPVLLISTGPIADSFWPLLPEAALVERYRLITYRQRLRTQSIDRPVPVSFAEHAADAVSLLGQLGVDRAHVVGHSTGAVIALQLAGDRPEIVHSLALLEPTLPCAPSAAAFFERVGAILGIYASGDGDRAMAEFLSLACSLDWDTCRVAIDKHVPGGVARAMKHADNWFSSYVPALSVWQFGHDQVEAISQPVLSVVGTHSDRWFVDGHELLHTWFPRIEDSTIEGVGHLLHMQRPQPVAEGIAEFLARHPMTLRSARAGTASEAA